MPRAALRLRFRRFISEAHSIARGVTSPDVGSGALFGEPGSPMHRLQKSEIRCENSGTACLDPSDAGVRKLCRCTTGAMKRSPEWRLLTIRNLPGRVVRVPRTLTWRQKLRSSTRGFSNALRLIRISILPATTLHLRMLKFGPNVQDEPRRDLARLVPLYDSNSAVSLRKHIPSHEA